jgi:predicted Rossmann fold flavoprotein
MSDYDLIVAGGGAAGFYGAIQAAEINPGLRVVILEKSAKLLSKVRVSGGGRCNVTHRCFDPIKLSHHYPRGEKPLREVFKIYDASKTASWFASKGLELKAEEDGRMFPVTDDSQTIIDCFTREGLRHQFDIRTGEQVVGIRRESGLFHVSTGSGKIFSGKKILVATGGNPKPEAYQWIINLGHTIRPPIPSLFTFNDAGKKFTDLMGISVPDAEVRLATTKFAQRGPLLITHWGLSGPAVIKLSAWAAEYLHEVHYNFTVLVSWIGPVQEEKLREQLRAEKNIRAKQKICVNPLFGVPQRLWLRLCELSEIEPEKIWGEAAHKQMNKLVENLIKCPFKIKGKTTFKEEFVTCGGVEVKEINFDTMESRIMKDVFFAGEVLNIDGETGGFNFQSAWSTAYLAASSMSF